VVIGGQRALRLIMKILVLSDLHNEFSRFEPPSIEADIVILAGDIDVLTRGVSWANQTFQMPVIYCCGNHEFYRGHIDRTLTKIREAAADHVHVLENEVLIADGVRFLVASGWTDFAATGDVTAAAWICAQGMNDFRMIRAGLNYRRLRPADLIERNAATYAFLSLELSRPFDGKTIVVTHHCPIPEAAGSQHEGHLSAAYFNRWYALVEQSDLWIFGHTHECVDLVLGRCRVVSNAKGYPGEMTGFDPGKILEV
jgi:predicted phosphodiesterase